MAGEGVHNPADLTDVEAALALIFAEVEGLDGEAMRGTDNAALAVFYTAVRAAFLDELAPANIPADIDTLLERQLDNLANQTSGRACIATLRVSPDGDDSDGLTWATAYQNPVTAFNASGAGANDQTLILVAPGTYDINITGIPTFAQNVCILGSHRDWAIFENNHAGGTAVLRLTGRSAIQDIRIDCGTGTNDGLIMTADGSRLDRIHIHAHEVTGAHTGLEISGGSDDGRFRDIVIHGTEAHTLGLLIDDCALSNFENILIKDCLTGLQIISNASLENTWESIEFDNCSLGMDIDAGPRQSFHHIDFHGNTRNVDDEVGDHEWFDIHGRLDIEISPDNLVGVTVATGGAGAYGADTEILSAVSRDNPFRVVGFVFGPDASPAEWYQVRFSDDSGATFFDVQQFISDRRAGSGAPSGTEHIFNAGTRISCSARDISGGDNVDVWLQVQEV